MTTWSVVNDDTQESGHRRRYFRYAVSALAALLVVSLGFVLVPREPAAPVPPPFAEQARASAYSDTLSLTAAGAGLYGAGDGALPASGSGEVSPAVGRALGRTVTLLTVQARALMLPSDAPSPGSSAAATSAAAVPPPPTPADFAAALHASGVRRLTDAQTADGGMARLLAGAGAAQLVAAEDIAAAAGVALGAPAGDALPGTAPAAPETLASGCPPTATESSSGAGGGEAGSTGAGLGAALAAVVSVERELVYAYQAALPRLQPASAGPASDFHSQHERLLSDAEALSSARCTALPPTPAGYGLDGAFLADPAPELGKLEAGSLPAYGDVVALSVGAERAWSIAALQSAVRRTIHWGASTGPVPGMTLDEARLPELAVASPAPAPKPSAGPESSGQSPALVICCTNGHTSRLFLS